MADRGSDKIQSQPITFQDFLLDYGYFPARVESVIREITSYLQESEAKTEVKGKKKVPSNAADSVRKKNLLALYELYCEKTPDPLPIEACQLFNPEPLVHDEPDEEPCQTVKTDADTEEIQQQQQTVAVKKQSDEGVRRSANAFSNSNNLGTSDLPNSGRFSNLSSLGKDYKTAPNDPVPHVYSKENGLIIPDSEWINQVLAAESSTTEYLLNTKARHKLFCEMFPLNINLDEVAIKVSFLSKYLPDNIKLQEIVPQIVSIKPDEALQMGDDGIVRHLSVYRINGQKKNCYAFGSQYCACHFPKAFPFYDSNTDIALRYFRDQTEFYCFSNDELRDYEKYKWLLQIFRNSFQLQDIILLDICRYLQIAGKQIKEAEKQQTEQNKNGTKQKNYDGIRR